MTYFLQSQEQSVFLTQGTGFKPRQELVDAIVPFRAAEVWGSRNPDHVIWVCTPQNRVRFPLCRLAREKECNYHLLSTLPLIPAAEKTSQLCFPNLSSPGAALEKLKETFH